MNSALLVGIVITVVGEIKMRSGADVPQQPRANVSMTAAMAISYLASAIAGVVFFSTDLIPSSMTGDPGRHFQALVDLNNSAPAIAYKPIYYLWAGVFIHLPFPVGKDQLFVLFNIFALGLVTTSVALLATRALVKCTWPSIVVIIFLTAFGYPLFALQYGYYTLLLSAAFLFSSFALMHSFLDSNRPFTYFLFSIMGCGVILTHSYLAPSLFLIILFAAIWQCRSMPPDSQKKLLKHLLPYWILIGSVSVLSNGILGGSIDTLGQIIQAKGWGTDNFWANTLFFAVLAAPHLIIEHQSRKPPFLLLLVGCSAGFSLFMYALYQNGLAAPYYVTRNHLVLMPLLAIGAAGTLQRMKAISPKAAAVLQLTLLLLVILPYLIYSNKPLATTNAKFLDLLDENSGPLYFVNAKTASYSPLQFTARDRALLESSQHPCFEQPPGNMAVLGTDHAVIWFGVYANLYPSLVMRKDGFIERPGYIENYELWKVSADAEYIGVIKHIDYFATPDILSDIKSSTAAVCEGDSFVIYRKLRQR
jgi:hypothetical protein